MHAGLLRSAAQGFQDLVAFPLAALEARSPLQFITGLGFGSASLVRNLSGVFRTMITEALILLKADMPTIPISLSSSAANN